MQELVIQLVRGSSFYPEMLFWAEFVIDNAIDWLEHFDMMWFMVYLTCTLWGLAFMQVWITPYPIFMSCFQNSFMYLTYDRALDTGTYAQFAT